MQRLHFWVIIIRKIVYDVSFVPTGQLYQTLLVHIPVRRTAAWATRLFQASRFTEMRFRLILYCCFWTCIMHISIQLLTSHPNFAIFDNPDNPSYGKKCTPEYRGLKNRIYDLAFGCVDKNCRSKIKRRCSHATLKKEKLVLSCCVHLLLRPHGCARTFVGATHKKSKKSVRQNTKIVNVLFHIRQQSWVGSSVIYIREKKTVEKEKRTKTILSNVWGIIRSSVRR